MRALFTLFLISICVGNTLNAQDTIRTLIISEARIDNQHSAYLELTNVGNSTLDLSKFEVGRISPWTIPYFPEQGSWFMLPKHNLAPGKSFVIAKISDYSIHKWFQNPETNEKFESKPELLKLADMQIHIQETFPAISQTIDSVSINAGFVNVWNGSYCWYLRYHFFKSDGFTRDSVVVDQVNGIFSKPLGSDRDVMHDVAGYPKASGNCILIRKASVTQGNPNFEQSRGIDPASSEWIPIPFLKGIWEPERAVFWTVGNHGSFQLNSLSTSELTINWNTFSISVPWGFRNDDSLIYKFNRIPGIAWHYSYNGVFEDSAFTSVRTGDKLTVYACGNVLQSAELTLNVIPSTDNDNIVIPKNKPNSKGYYRNAKPFCVVSNKVLPIDTISALPYACRADTLIRYLEFPAQATYEFVFNDGKQHADLTSGDKLRVTSKSGLVKEYYLKTNKYIPSSNANLSAITWPDIPNICRNINGWHGDTLPGFSPTKYNYNVEIPFDIENIPALVAFTQNPNSTVKVTRALPFKSSDGKCKIVFTSISEDGLNTKIYTVNLVKLCSGCDQMAFWQSEPFITQFVFKQDFNNDFVEIYNPGYNQIDLSNYMITFGYYQDAYEAITRKSLWTDWNYRYVKYIPGYRWVNEATWNSTPARVVPDPNIYSFIGPGNTFVLAFLNGDSSSATYPKRVTGKINIDFKKNPWNEDLSTTYDCTLRQWWGQKIMLFKILNDSIKLGLKAANDPKDFKLIDVLGDSSGVRWNVAGRPIDQCYGYIRKPGIYKGNPVIQSSFGTNDLNSEWNTIADGLIQTYAPIPWPENRLIIADGIGEHFMNKPTVFNSKVNSNVYKVSEGYSLNESITGIGLITNVAGFYQNIIKLDTGQHLKIIRHLTGIELTNSDTIKMGDSLIVVSADQINTTKYYLNTTLLSNNAVLTSLQYNISIFGDSGVISNFSFDTNLKTVYDSIEIPAGATLDIIGPNQTYVPFRNYVNGAYQYTKANEPIVFLVTAEDGITHITYHLQPRVNLSDAYLFSTIYNVNQANRIITGIPAGISVQTFLGNVFTLPGATVKLIDAYGSERNSGNINTDDRILVTSADRKTERIYHLYQHYCGSQISNIDDPIKYFFPEGLNATMLVEDVSYKLSEGMSAIVVISDSTGNIKLPTDYIALSDIIEIYRCNSVYYKLKVDVLTHNRPLREAAIKLFPNPVKDEFTITGLIAGSQVIVYNSLGTRVISGIVDKNNCTFSMKDYTTGVYMVKILLKEKTLVVKKIIVEK